MTTLRQNFHSTSYIQIWASQETNIGKIRNIIDDAGQGAQSKNETLLAEKEVTNEFDFMDGELHQIKLECSNDELKVYITDGQLLNRNQGLIEPILKANLQINNYVRLDNGTAYLGFTQETVGIVNQACIENWTFVSDAKANQQDPWSGLSLDYRSHWPLHMMFSPDVLEKYNQLFRFLLPVRRAQLDLQNIWAQKIRGLRELNYNRMFRQTMQLR